MIKIFTISGEQYTPVSVGRNYVFRQYDSIYSFLKRNFNDDFSSILCKPIQSGESIVFYTDQLGDFRPIDEFSSEQKNQILIQYNAYLHKVHIKCKEYKLSNDVDYASWADILTIVFDHDSNMLFSDGIKLAIVWGWKFRLKEKYFLPFEVFSHTLIGENQSINEDAVPDSDLNDQQTVETDLNDVDSEDIIDEKFELEEVEEEASEIEEDTFIPPLIAEKKPVIAKEKHWFLRFLDAFERFAKKYWWLILIFLAIILWLLLLKSCERKPFSAAELSLDEQNELYDEIMPDQSRHRVIPIDTTKFIDDEDSHSRIISDVVNIALKNKKQNFKHFAIELKHGFDKEDYKVVYYDDETDRLQMTFPENERANIKETIKSKMAKYDLLIWDESVFKSSKTLNDPDMKSPDKAWYLKSINADKAWDITMGDTSVILAIIDDGFDLDHVELRNKIVKRYNIVNDDSRVFSGPDRFHGTHVAGIAVANGNNGKGLSGIAPKCLLMPIQAAGEDGFFTMTDIIDGVLYAIKNGADVINMSLGKQFSEDIKMLSPGQMDDISKNNGIDEADFWKELFQVAEENNVTIVLAGGNQNILVGLDPMQRSNQVIKVAATDKANGKATFSNFFRKSDPDCFISAPGVKIYSTFPGNNYDFLDGTSMASPIVAGAICLMKSVNPKLTNTQIRKILHSTSKPLSNRNLAPLLQIDKAVRKARTF
jgi:subtilisin family serine protease